MLPAKESANRADNDVFAQYESNVQSYARVFPQTFTRALGSEMWDVNGRRYLDFLSGAGSLNFGHNNPVLKQALIDYIVQDGITHSLDLHTSAKAQFLEAMQEIVLRPRGLDYVVQFTGPTGTNSVEAALKIARIATGRTNIVYFTNGFHGVSLGALSVTGNEFYRRAAGVPLPHAISMPYDGHLGDGPVRGAHGRPVQSRPDHLLVGAVPRAGRSHRLGEYPCGQTCRARIHPIRGACRNHCAAGA